MNCMKIDLNRQASKKKKPTAQSRKFIKNRAPTNIPNSSMLNPAPEDRYDTHFYRESNNHKAYSGHHTNSNQTVNDYKYKPLTTKEHIINKRNLLESDSEIEFVLSSNLSNKSDIGEDKEVSLIRKNNVLYANENNEPYFNGINREASKTYRGDHQNNPVHVNIYPNEPVNGYIEPQYYTNIISNNDGNIDTHSNGYYTNHPHSNTNNSHLYQGQLMQNPYLYPTVYPNTAKYLNTQATGNAYRTSNMADKNSKDESINQSSNVKSSNNSNVVGYTTNNMNKSRQANTNYNNPYINTVNSVYNEMPIPGSVADQEDPNVIIENILKNDTIKDVLYKIPNYFFILKQEYINQRNKLERVINDFQELNDTNSNLINKITNLTNELNEKRKLIITLTCENEQIKGKQAILIAFRDETQGYINILKEDNEDKLKEIEKLLKENGELKCKESKGIYEKEMILRKEKELFRSFSILENQKELIREELRNLSTFVNMTFQSLMNSGMIENIHALQKENVKLMNFYYFYKNCINTMKLLGIEIEKVKEFIINGDKINKELITVHKNEIGVLEDDVQKLEDEKKKVVMLCLEIKKKNIQVLDGILAIPEEVSKLKEILEKDRSKECALQKLESSRKEIEIQKVYYENIIKKLTARIEEREDVWDVFE